nr:MAG TPA: hypothetical protein [Caudoviricetes sp.]
MTYNSSVHLLKISIMEKRYGATEQRNCLMQIGRNKWELIYGFGTDGISGWTYRQRFSHKPQLEEIKEYIITQINRNVDERILCGLKWNDIPIWLSTENQINYKAAYDYAIQTNGASLPITFKFGTDESPVYHTFNNIDDLQDFYSKALTHVQETLSNGWREKDNINWDEFTL